MIHKSRDLPILEDYAMPSHCIHSASGRVRGVEEGCSLLYGVHQQHWGETAEETWTGSRTLFICTSIRLSLARLCSTG